MKISIVLVFCFTIFFTSCSPYQQVYRSDDTTAKYAFADSLYKKGKYKKALKLMEQIVPAYRGKPQAERLMFIYANTFYQMKAFYLAGYQFERFETSYPKSDSVEIASFKSAKSYYQLSPRFSLDQEDTYKALDNLQAFINTYPNTQYRVEANQLVSELRAKLELKDITVAKQYLKISDYKPAIGAFENFISDHPGSPFRKDAFFGRLDAGYRLALNSVPILVEERLNAAKEYYNSFVKYYKATELMTDAEEILKDINKRLNIEEPTS
ncbi:MAG: outer membrane protein assembly factor BamD [Ulvibacter sp.]|jgi:outer membrane protein assembly factor BamD